MGSGSDPKHLAGLGALVLLAATFPFFGAEGLVWNDLSDPGSPSHRILFELRIPRFLLAILIGGSLAVLGGTYQILFHNPLAEPYLLGIASAVSLGAALAELVLGASGYGPAAIASGLVLGLLLTFAIASLSKRGGSLERVVLFGMGANFVLSSALFLLLSYYSKQMGGGSIRWLFGQIPWLTLSQSLLLLAASAPFLVILHAMGRWLDALSLGDEVARSLGVRPERTKPLVLTLSSIFLSLLLAMTGSIGFVGLVIPHAVRLVFRPANTRALFAYSFVLGGVFLTASDLLSRRLMPPMEFPIGVMTTLLGGPAFLWLLARRPR